MAIPSNVIYFTGYDALRYSDNSPVRKLAGDEYTPLFAGSIARTVAVSAIGPIEMFRTRLQATSSDRRQGPKKVSQFSATMRGMVNLVQDQGYRSLWRGLGLTLWRDVPFSAVYWYGYETLRVKLAQLPISAFHDSSSSAIGDENNTNTSTFVSSFTAGFISGAFAATITQPFDVGKTRQQVFNPAISFTALKKGRAQHQTPMLKTLRGVYLEEGLKGLWRGWAARTLKVAPSCAIMISSYELGKRFSAASAANAKAADL
jgi:solute carrier family 25 protein 39/40